MITNPCNRCKRTACPPVCYPKKDYQRAMRKKGVKNGNPSINPRGIRER